MSCSRASSQVLALRPGTPMDQWKHAIVSGNRAVEARDDLAACGHYRLAMTLARTMLETWPDHDAAIAAWVVSHHNLADLAARNDACQHAAALLIAAHRQLQRLIEDERQTTTLREMATRHTRHTYAEMLRFAQRHPDNLTMARAIAVVGPTPPSAAAAGFPVH